MTDRRTRRATRVLAILVVLAVGVGAWWLIVAQGLTTPRALEGALDARLDTAALASWQRMAVVFVVAVAGLVCLLPSPVVIAASALVLGAGAGFAVAVSAIGVAVAIERWLAATIIGEALHARLARRHPGMDERVAAWGLPGVVLVRALGTPTTVIAWASSATSLRWWAVSLGCMAGSMPRAFAYATLGAAGVSLLRPADWTWQVHTALVMLLALLATSVIVARRLRVSE
jgi:uncharacterized membrane protein YdjX (TVP38/TMEM64 family)